jgi:hypothetical protein
MRPYPEKTHHKKRVGGVAQGGGPKYKPQYCKNQKNKKKYKVVSVSSSSAISRLPFSS